MTRNTTMLMARMQDAFRDGTLHLVHPMEQAVDGAWTATVRGLTWASCFLTPLK